MTLNLMLTSPERVFLSSDFRITGTRPIDDPPTQKQIPVMKQDWAGIVAFSGVAEFGPGSRRFVLAERLPDLVNSLSFDVALPTFAGALAELGSALRVPSSSAAHTFCVTGFEFGQPFAMLVSNFQTLPGAEVLAESAAFKATLVRRSAGQLFVGGRTDAVSDEERKMLLGMLETTRDNKQIHRALAETNRRANERDSLVGSPCFTTHMLSDAYVEAMPHGIPPDVEYLPKFAVAPFIKQGLLQPTVDSDGNPLPRRLIGMFIARSVGDRMSLRYPSFVENGDLLLMAYSRQQAMWWMYSFRNVADPIDKQPPAMLVQLGEQALQNGDAKQALKLFDAALTKDANNAQALLGRAHVLILDAVDCITKAKEGETRALLPEVDVLKRLLDEA